MSSEKLINGQKNLMTLILISSSWNMSSADIAIIWTEFLPAYLHFWGTRAFSIVKAPSSTSSVFEAGFSVRAGVKILSLRSLLLLEATFEAAAFRIASGGVCSCRCCELLSAPSIDLRRFLEISLGFGRLCPEELCGPLRITDPSARVVVHWIP